MIGSITEEVDNFNLLGVHWVEGKHERVRVLKRREVSEVGHAPFLSFLAWIRYKQHGGGEYWRTYEFSRCLQHRTKFEGDTRHGIFAPLGASRHENIR